MKRQILLIAASICGLATSSQASLIAWYKFDEGVGATTALNAVGGSSTGAIGSNVTTGVSGISGNAYIFSGGAAQDDIVDMGNANFLPSVSLSSAITLSTWINTPGNSGGRNVAVFAGDDTVSNSYVDLGLVGPSQPQPFGAAYGRLRPATNTNISNVFSTPTLVNDDQWHHIAVTIDLVANNITLYVDGVSTATRGLVSAAFPAFNNFEVGRLGRSAPVDAFLGLIDDVQVYDTALSGSEIEFLYNNPGMAVPEPSAIALAGLGLGLLYVTSRRKKRA